MDYNVIKNKNFLNKDFSMMRVKIKNQVSKIEECCLIIEFRDGLKLE